MTTRLALLALVLSALAARADEAPAPSTEAPATPSPEAPAPALPASDAPSPAPAAPPAPGAEPAPAPGILTKPPVLKRFVEAPYPPEAQAAKREGAVVLEIEIGADGKVANPRVTEPAGYGFDEAALAAVAQFEFEPAEIDHQPAAVRVAYRYEFVYRPPPSPEPPPESEKPHVIVLEGTVLERGTRVPVLDAVVTVEREGAKQESRTAEGGRFAFEDLAPGTWRLGVRAEKHEPYDTSEEVRVGEVATATYYVRKRSGEFEVTVRARREKKEVARRTLTVQEIQKIPGTQGDAIRVVQNLPGVARTPLGLGPVVVRGGRAGDTRTYVDGQLVPLLFHFGGLTSVINSEFLESLDFYPGNYPVRFGRSIAGAIDVNTRPGRRDRLHGYANVNLFDTTLFLEGPLPANGAFMASVRRSYIDVILPVVLRFIDNADAVNFTSAPRYWDYQLKADFDWGKDKLTFFLLGSSDQLALLLTNPAAVSTEGRSGFSTGIGFHRFNARWERKLAPGLTNRLSATVGTESTRNSVGTDIYINVDLNSLTIRDDLSWKLSDTLTLDAGLDFFGATYLYGVQSPPLPLPGQVPNPSLDGQLQYASDTGYSLEPALYVDAVWKPLPGLKLVPGLRWDYEQYIRRAWFDPRITAFYELNEAWLFKASAGLYHQAPTPEKLTKKFGNPNLIEETSIQYAAGVEWKFAPSWDVDLQLYWKELRNEATNALALSTASQQQAFGRTQYRNTGSGHAYGAEMLLRKAPGGNWFGFLAVSLGQAFRQAAPGEPLVQSPLNQRYNVVAVATYKFPWDIDVGARVRLTDGSPYTTYVARIYDVDSDNILGVPAPVRRTERRPAFFQMDVRIDKKWTFERWILDAYIDLLNATWYDNREGESWNYDFTKFRPVTGLPLFPAFGVKGEF